VFVHGFGGSAVTTWKEFPDLLPRQAGCAGWDFVFYGYDGLYTQANISAQLLHGFLHKLGTKPAQVINPTLDPSCHRAAAFSYDSILLVAHSLGAVVTRLALLNARKTRRPWLTHTQMVLFAPAHMGANTVALGAEALSVIPGVGALLAAVARFRYQPLQDLATGSQTLQFLLAETQKALAAGNAQYLVARAVYVGDQENIVTTATFCGDPPLTVMAGKSHMSVCKPQATYLDPVLGLLP
jgi:pimeloyl-ACP methyl ester carboxylesterase